MEAVGNDDTRDPRSHEPWWNNGCEDMYQQVCEARITFEKNPSLEASKAFRRLQRQFKKKVMAVQSSYTYRMHVSSERFGPELPPMQENGEKIDIKQKKVKKKKKGAKDDGSESDGDNLDLSQEMYPLSHYVSDQEELVNQMFSIIKGPKLEAMLPPALRSIPLHELKSLCLHELRGMSKKRIHCAINGQNMEGSSESEEDEDTEKSTNTNTHNKENTVSPIKKKKNNVDKSAETPDDQRGLPAYLMKTIKVEGHDEDGSGDKGSTSGGKKSVLELLELQMRARIIKTMLEKNDGKAISEDALLALMESADHTAIDTQISEIQDENTTRVTDAKDIEEDKEIKGTKESDRRKSNGGRRLKDSSKSSRSEHKKEPHHKKGCKRHRSADVKESDDDNDKRSRKDRNSDKRQQKKKKKITRREFEERMKRAKKNRSYRQRRSSEDELKSSAGKNKEVSEDMEVHKAGKAKEENAEGTKAKEEGENASEKEEGEAVSEKEEGEAASEKEEGECDTDDEEDGACSPSDISSASYYSSRSYTSRSRSRSYSRSYSRSPVRRRGSGRGRSRSRSWTRSRSRSRSNEKRRDSGRWSKRKPRDHGSSGNLKMSTGTVSLPNSTNQKPPKEEEDNWGQSCDIEFVDSEEDFDDNATDSAKNTSLDSKKPLPMKGQNSDRASISFSFQKKNVPSITPNVDLDDLPLKSNSLGIVKKRRGSDVEVIPEKEEPKQTHIINLDSPVKEDEILISSDSEQETKDLTKTKSVRVERRELNPSAAKHESPKKNITAPKNSNHSSSSDLMVADENIPTSKEFNKKDSEAGAELSVDAQREACSEISSHEKNKQKDQDCSDSVNTVNIKEQEDGDLPETKEIDTDDRVDKIEENSSRHEENMYDKTENKNTLDESSNVDKIANENQGDFSQNDSFSTENKNLLIKDNRIANENTDTNEIHEQGKASDIAEEVCTSKQDMEPAGCDIMLDADDKQDFVEKDENSVNVADYIQNISSDSEESKCTNKIKETPSNIDSAQGPNIDVKRKIVLEHLQESYNEDEGFSIQDPCSQNTDTLVSKVNTQESNTDSVKIISEDNECTSKEMVSTTVEVNSELHDKGLTAEHEAVRDKVKENSSFDKSEENDEGIQENECHEETQGTSDDFYRGADQLSFSDEDTGNLDEEDIKDIRNKEVEPIRINTGLIRKRVTRSQKTEMVAPAKSWTKKERKKKEKPKDVLAMEGIGLLKQSLAENVQSPSSKDDDPHGIERREEEQMNDDDTCTSWGVSSISSKEETSLDSRAQSPKESEIQVSGDSPKSGNDETSETQEMSTGSKKTGQETEIIGVIEASSTLGNNQIEDIDVGGSSWSMRWLQSEKVQKVVSSSKMLSRVRKKIQKKEKATKVAVTEKPEPPIRKLPEPVLPIIGSIEEYERLFGMKAKKSGDETSNAPDESTQENVTSGETAAAINPTVDEHMTHQSPKKRAAFGSDDEGEDSEEEALWSKILGK